MKTLRDSPLALVAVLCLLFIVGCSDDTPSPPPPSTQRVGWTTQDEAFIADRYLSYLKGDIDSAAQALEQAVRYVEAKRAEELGIVHARTLWGLYVRLSHLESYRNRPALAELYMVQAQHWKIQEVRLSGISSTEIAQTGQASAVNILDFVTRFDNSRTDGRGPRYRGAETGPATKNTVPATP